MPSSLYWDHVQVKDMKVRQGLASVKSLCTLYHNLALGLLKASTIVFLTSAAALSHQPAHPEDKGLHHFLPLDP
jgi:hypothetical protein